MVMYGYKFDVAQAGQLFDTTYRVVDSFTANAEIQFGRPVKRDSTVNPEKLCLPWADIITVNFLGIALFQHNEEGKYLVKREVAVLTEGRVWVESVSADDIVAGEKAYLSVNAGLFTNDATNNLLIGKFLTNATVDQILVGLEIGKL